MAQTRNQGQPPPPTPPPQPQPINPPPYRRFVSETAEKRYQEIKGNTFTKERGFDFGSLTRYPIFAEKIEQKGWHGIVNMVTGESNKTIALEFLSNAFAAGETSRHAKVRGKRVGYSSDDIARVLGLTRPDECGVIERRKESGGGERNADYWAGLLAGLVREGAGWKGKGGVPQRIDVVDLLPIFKAWSNFLLTTIERTSAKAEMTRARFYILQAVLSDDDIDVARLMYASLKDLINTTGSTAGHCCLINALCQEAQVPSEPTDIYLTSQLPISDKTMVKYEKEQEKFERELARQREQQGQPQMMEEDQAHQIPQMPQVQPPMMQQQQGYIPPHFAHYTYAMANWAMDISSRDRIPPPAFHEEFIIAADAYRRGPDAMTNAYQRFASPEDMERYFAEERARGAAREASIREEYYRIQAEQPNTDEHPHYYPFPPSGPGGSSGAGGSH